MWTSPMASSAFAESSEMPGSTKRRSRRPVRSKASRKSSTFWTEVQAAPLSALTIAIVAPEARDALTALALRSALACEAPRAHAERVQRRAVYILRRDALRPANVFVANFTIDAPRELLALDENASLEILVVLEAPEIQVR